MTRRTARELLNLVFRDEAGAELELIRRRDVVHAEDRVARAHEAFGTAVTVEAPFHLQRLVLPHQRHAIDLAVTGRAADAFVDVNAVVEVHKIRQIVDARPLDRFPRAEALTDRLEERAVREDLRMAVHAGFRWRNSGEGG